MDIIFHCSHCEQELSIDSEGAGSQINCPACGKTVTVPNESEVATSSGAGTEPSSTPAETEAAPVVSIPKPAAPRVDKHFSVPVHEGPTESLIGKSLKPLEVAAKESDRRLRVKSFRHSDHVEVGKDHFDEHVSDFLVKVGEEHIVSITPFSYTHQELASRAWITDYGILVVYKG